MPRKRTNEEILSSLSCNVSEAAEVLGIGWKSMTEIIESKKVHTFASGKRTRVSVPSLKAFAIGTDRSEAA